jgi:hypothetical protein
MTRSNPIGLRRRRRQAWAAAGSIAVAIVAVIIPAGLGVLGHGPRPAERHQLAVAPTLYVVSGSSQRGTITPISTVTDTPGTPINIGPINSFDGAQVVISPEQEDRLRCQLRLRHGHPDQHGHRQGQQADPPHRRSRPRRYRDRAGNVVGPSPGSTRGERCLKRPQVGADRW